MNKKMKALLDRINAKLASSQAHMEAGDAEAAAADMDEADVLQKAFELEERVYKAQQAMVPFQQPASMDAEGGEGVDKHFDGFRLIAKCLRGGALTQDERELIAPNADVANALVEKGLTTGNGAVNGENYLIPEDVDHTIRELRRNFKSAKELVTVIPTTTLSGAFTWEKGGATGLVSFDDGTDVPDGKAPEFKTVKWSISFKGAVIPISNILSVVEAAGLTAYLNNWFVKCAVISENADIFAALKKDKTATALPNLEALKDSIELDMDPDCLISGRIVTNQTGFNRMSKEKDATGRSYLQPDPVNTARKLFNGLPILVYSDAQLPNVGDKAPVYYGDTGAGVYFMEFKYLFFASSVHAAFTSNKTLMRVIEGYDVIEADKAAYCYGLIDAPTAATALDGGEPVAPLEQGGTAPLGE